MFKNLTCTSEKLIHTALLVIRAGFGIMFILHGWPKITGGVETWTWLGGSMANIGLDFAPAFWGFMASIAEFGGGIFLLIGLFTRPVAAAMLFTMLIATIMHISVGDPLNTVLHPLKGLVVFAGFLLSGAGKYSLDYKLVSCKDDRG